MRNQNDSSNAHLLGEDIARVCIFKLDVSILTNANREIPVAILSDVSDPRMCQVRHCHVIGPTHRTVHPDRDVGAPDIRENHHVDLIGEKDDVITLLRLKGRFVVTGFIEMSLAPLDTGEGRKYVY